MQEIGDVIVSNADEEFFRSRGFGQTIGFGSTPAVIVIDLINAFTNKDLPLGAPLEDVIEQTRRVISAARRKAIPVIYTSVAYEDRDLVDAGHWSKKMEGLMTLRWGTPEVDVDARVGRLATEPIILKKYASAFFGTDLVSRLNSQQVDTLIITGCTTSGCVRATAVDAVQYGLRPMVVREAVGDRSQAAHDQSLFDLQAKYADVMGIDEVLIKLG